MTYQTRFVGPMANRARLYRAFVPVGISPGEVDAMTPSHIAACLHFDELDAAEGMEYVEARAVQNVPPPPAPDIDRKLTRRERRELAEKQGTPWQEDEGEGLIIA